MQHKFSKIFTLVLVLQFILIGAFGQTSTARAQEAPQASIGVSPTRFDDKEPLSKSWFIEQLNPGDEVEREYSVFNYMDSEQKVNLFANDATQTQDGNFTYQQNYEQSNLVGKWVTIQEKDVTISSKSQKNFKFKLKIPAGTPNGEYAGVISAQLPGVKNEEGVTIESRIGTRLYITVGKELKLATKAENFNFFSEQ